MRLSQILVLLFWVIFIAVPAAAVNVGECSTVSSVCYYNVLAGTSGGSGVISAQIPNNTNAIVLASGPATLYSVRPFNSSSSLAYLKLYNATSATCGSGTPADRAIIPANANGTGYIIDSAVGEKYSTGLTICVTAGFADGDTTAVAANTIQLNVSVFSSASPVTTASLTASPAVIPSSGTSTLTWGSTNATSCTGSGFSTGAGSPTSGTATVSPSSTTTYSVTCTGTFNSASASATVTVGNAFFVATTGNDSNPGTIASPFLTLGRCRTAMQGSFSTKTCYVRAGTYNLTSSISLGSSDVNETWSYYPSDGVGSPKLTQSSAFAYFLLNDGANNITITGFTATGFQHIATVSCGNVPQASFIFGPTTVSGATANFTATYNTLANFDCGIDLVNATNPIVSYNSASTVEYVAFGCSGCTGASSQTVWQGNVAYDVDPDMHGPNGYGITMGPNYNTNYYSRNFTLRQNVVYNSPNWECLDDHAGLNIWWVDNLCVGPGNNTAYNAAALSSALPINNIIQAMNIDDIGAPAASMDSFVNCGYVLPCSSNSTGVTGGKVTNNLVLNNNSSCIIASAPVVAVNNPSATYCGTFAPETVSSIDFSGATTAAFAAGQANAIVATLTPHMSASYWDFPVPPGTLSIGGTNSGGFVICNGTQICQSGGGTAAGTYNDFSVTATLHGMKGTPVTVASGTLTLTSNAFFVSTSGSDGNSGTLASPFATLGKCQTAMEAGPGKTCFIRAGTYSSLGATATGCNNNSAPADVVKLTHAGGDDGTTYSYYPPDGVGSAVFDGGSSVPTAFCVYHVKNVIINGLKFTNFTKSALFDANWDADDGNGQNNSFVNDTVTGTTGNPAINFSGWVEYGSAVGNTVQSVSKQGISISTTQSATSGGASHIAVVGNAILNSCTAVSDCGAVYIQDYQSPSSVGIFVRNNYLYQINAASSGGKGIYLDDGTSNVTARGNVTVAGGALFACAQIHGGSNDVFYDNVCDEGSGSDILFYQQTTQAGTWTMMGNGWRGNTIVCLSSSACGNGFIGSNSPPNPADTSGNIFWNFGSSSMVTNTSSGGASYDASPLAINPGLSCWQLGRSFGPPGFSVPQTGTAPSWPHSC